MSMINPTPALWDAVVHTKSGNEYDVTLWQGAELTHNFEGVTGTMDLPAEDPVLQYVQELTTDVFVYRNNVLLYRLRVMKREDEYDEDAHTVKITVASYEALLERRIVVTPLTFKGIEQTSIATFLVGHTQDREDLGITYPTPMTTRVQTKSFEVGKTIASAMDDLAAADSGFDWWIDQNLQLHYAYPRIVTPVDVELAYGAQVSRLSRTSSAEDYASSIMVTGATSDTTIGTKTYHPPPPVNKHITPPYPFGLWEQGFAFTEIVTSDSLNKKAAWALSQVAIRLPTYKLTLAPTAWLPSLVPGATFQLRVQSTADAGLSFKVKVRVEELQLQLSPDGAEDVSMGVRAEQEERPLVGDDLTQDTLATGLSRTTPTARVSSVWGLADFFIATRDRIERMSRLSDAVDDTVP